MSATTAQRTATPSPPPLPYEVLNVRRSPSWFRQQAWAKKKVVEGEKERLTLQPKQQSRAMEEQRARGLRKGKALQWSVEFEEERVRINPLPLRQGYLSPAVKASPLYRLPVEVRERILRYALQSGDPVDIGKITATERGKEEGSVLRVSWRRLPALLKVSRQVEAEAGRVWYGCVVFRMGMGAVDITPLSAWLTETDAGLLAQVQRFTLALSPTCFSDLQAIVETKLESGGMQAKAQALVKMIREGLPNARVKVEGPTRRMRKWVHVDAKRAGLVGKGVVNGVWREWMRELEKALGDE